MFGGNTEPDLLIHLYNLIVQQESTILDLRTPDQFKQCHILTAVNISTPYIQTIMSMECKKTVILCFQDEEPSPDLIISIQSLDAIEQVVHVEINTFQKNYPFFCTTSRYPKNETHLLSQYPTRL